MASYGRHTEPQSFRVEVGLNDVALNDVAQSKD